ncbi:MAG: hypothetical protein IKN99_06180 [Bacteroidales bacterium]|nr:hypothetical protein [Bacteroidales bacterium]
MHGPWGRRGAIIARFGWKWDYLHHEISWPAVCKMLADGVRYDSDNENDGTSVEITDDNADAIAAMLNRSC